MKGAAVAALALSVVLPMALARAFPGRDGKPAAEEHVPEIQRAREHPRGMAPVIFTAAPVYAPLAALRGEERFPKSAMLMILRAGRTEALVTGFKASADASVSFDGKAVLFAGKKNAGDPWQIWEMPVEGGAPRLTYGGHGDAIRPLWMPGGRVVLAERGAKGFELMTAALDGSAALRLTYLPGNFIPDDVLYDGRVLFESGFPLGAGTTPEMYMVYPDGSGVESVRCDHGHAEKSGGREHGRQMASGDVVFTEGRRLARFTSALADESPIGSPAAILPAMWRSFRMGCGWLRIVGRGRSTKCWWRGYRGQRRSGWLRGMRRAIWWSRRSWRRARSLGRSLQHCTRGLAAIC